MIYQEIPVLAEGSSPEAVLVVYIQNYSTEMLVQERPLVVLCPGGGYNHLSVREAESEALQFLAMGYHAAVLKYSVFPAKFPTQLCELAWAMKYLRCKAAEFPIKWWCRAVRQEVIWQLHWGSFGIDNGSWTY